MDELIRLLDYYPIALFFGGQWFRFYFDFSASGLHTTFMMNIEISRVELDSIATVSDVLVEAAKWLETIGEPLWDPTELTPRKIETELEFGCYYLARLNGVPAGAYRFQEVDTLFWPEASISEAAYIHRIAVKRSFASKGIAAGNGRSRYWFNSQIRQKITSFRL